MPARAIRRLKTPAPPESPLVLQAGRRLPPMRTAPPGFRQFCRERELTEPADLIEAAAAYELLVEGLDHVARGSVLARAMRVADGTLTRDGAQRLFGILRRAGVLCKIGPDRFTLGPASRYGSLE